MVLGLPPQAITAFLVMSRARCHNPHTSRKERLTVIVQLSIQSRPAYLHGMRNGLKKRARQTARFEKCNPTGFMSNRLSRPGFAVITRLKPRSLSFLSSLSITA